MLTIIVAFSFLIVFALLIKKLCFQSQRNAFSEFQKKHPKSCRNGTFHSCPHCSAHDIISTQVGEELGMVMKAHCCAACGHELWRSKQKI